MRIFSSGDRNIMTKCYRHGNHYHSSLTIATSGFLSESPTLPLFISHYEHHFKHFLLLTFNFLCSTVTSELVSEILYYFTFHVTSFSIYKQIASIYLNCFLMTILKHPNLYWPKYSLKEKNVFNLNCCFVYKKKGVRRGLAVRVAAL